MPTRSAPSAATEVAEEEEEQQGMPGLQFNEPLSWRAGKTVPVAELLRRLQMLAKEMRDMEQEENERDSFTHVAKELASPNLLAHKDKGVRAWTAACLVDILRLCAPDAPYTGQQLKEIFNMFITTILPALSDPSNAYTIQHLYVLESLAQVKSIVLLTDIPSSETLIINLFASFFDVVSGSSKSSAGEQVGKQVEFNMASILTIMVDETASLPPDVVDIIVAQFLRADPRAVDGSTGKSKKNGALPVLDDKQSTLMMKELPPAYNMAKTICNTCPEKMSRYISQYFNDVIVDASTSSEKDSSKNRSKRRSSLDDSDDEMPGGPTEEDLKELHKAHQLLRELWRASPAVLQNVVPQLEAELSAENVQLRLLATETLGDLISGVGAAGLPPPSPMDPTAYPPLSIFDSLESEPPFNILTKPSSPQSFPQTHSQAYSNFLGRRHDKSPVVRSAWTIGIGRILVTSAGSTGLGQHEEDRLISDLARMMRDADEKVRLAAVKVVGNFSYRGVITKLGSSGGVNDSGSVLATLAERVRDRKHNVRVEAMTILARIWGVAAGDIAAGNEQVISTIGAAPAKILDTYYANDMEINALLDRVVFEQLLPLNYPPSKAKGVKSSNGTSQNTKGSQAVRDSEAEGVDPDKLWTERMLICVKSLDERSKKVFLAIQTRQVVLSKVMTAYLQRCEDYNGGVMDENETQIKEHLTRLIDSFAKTLPDPSKATSDLWKFAKMHDRRSYQLIRFCMAPESDFKTVFKAIKEFTKRVETSQSAPAGLLETMTPLLYRASVIVYNKTHVPSIMAYSRGNEKSLAATAHEILREISSRTPGILKAHVQEICKSLQDEAPSAKKANEAGAVDDLKACASFASKFPQEIPQDRKFIQAMTSFAMHGSPPEAAKQAVSVIMAASDKKEMHAKELVHKCIKGFEYGGEGFLSCLATLSQLMLLAPDQVDEESDAIIDIAIKQVLLQVRTPSTEPSDAYKWTPEVDTECTAKCLALKILVNRLRSHPTESSLAEIATPVYNLLSTLISQDGELSSDKNTPSTHKPRLRLFAARLYLKLCTKRSHDALLSPAAFNALALVAQDTEFRVRAGFVQRLRKYLGQQKLPQRFYTIPFLLAFEPNDQLRNETTTWIRSRAVFFSTLKSQQSSSASSGKANTVMESVFARLLSLLAHHPDYSPTVDDLTDFSRYIIFYLQNVATEENLSLIYHIAQRVKQCRDAILPVTTTSTEDAGISFDENLYHLSDLAQLTIRKFEDAHSWSIQTLPAKIRLPTSLFLEIKSHDEAQRIAEHNHLPEGVEEGVEQFVRLSMRKGHGSKKRRSEGGEHYPDGRESKRQKGTSTRKAVPKEKKAAVKAATRTPKRPAKRADEAAGSSERRTSGRVRQVAEKTYAERDSEDDDEEMEVLEWEVDGEVMPSRAFENGSEEAEEEDEGEEEDDLAEIKLSLRRKKAATPSAAKPKAKSQPKATDPRKFDRDQDPDPGDPDSMDLDPSPPPKPSPTSKSKHPSKAPKALTPKPTNSTTTRAKPTTPNPSNSTTKSKPPTTHTKKSTTDSPSRSHKKAPQHKPSPASSSIDELSPQKGLATKTTPLKSGKPKSAAALHKEVEEDDDEDEDEEDSEEEEEEEEAEDEDPEDTTPAPAPAPAPKPKTKQPLPPPPKGKAKTNATNQAKPTERPTRVTRSGR